MLQKHPDTKDCSSWTAEEIEELRNCLVTGDVAEVDTEMFGKKFSEIVLAGRSTKKLGRARQRIISRDELLIEV
jgi:hypothetical protein